MQWLNTIVDEAIKQTSDQPDHEVIVQSGISPSGAYHMGYLREIITADAVVRELRRRGHAAKHIHFVDDQDGFRKVPANLPADYQKYLGKPLYDMPAPDGSDQSYADFALKDFLDSVAALGIEIEVVRSHKKYQQGYFVPAIEKALEHLDDVKRVLEDISGRKVGDEWSPIQVNEDGYLKKRPFVGIDKAAQTISYIDKDGQPQNTSYAHGEVKLDWRLDWPARWWLVGVDVEPFGRDHGTKGGSYDTGVGLMKAVFKAKPPIPVPYDFVNRAGDTKKMSASKGNGINISEVVKVLPPEVARYFVLRYAPHKALFFDPSGGVVRLIDEFAELLAKTNKTASEEQLISLCTDGLSELTVSNVPFSHLVASYQAALKDPAQTMAIIERTEHGAHVKKQAAVIKAELRFIDAWLEHWAPEEVKFSLVETVKAEAFNQAETNFFAMLSDKIAEAPADADGSWFHQAIYDCKDTVNLKPQELFSALYRLLIGKTSGPRAGWFLSILPRDWLVKRLSFSL